MDWNLREGIILTGVCDQYILVGCSSTYGKCPRVMRINDSAAFIWRMMEKNASVEEMTEQLCKEYEVTDDTDVIETINEFAEVLKDNGYIVSGENDG